MTRVYLNAKVRAENEVAFVLAKLNQILAVEKGEKTKTQKRLTELHHKSQKAALYEGRVRTYKPSNEDGETLPPERQIVQLTASSVLAEMRSLLSPMWNLIASKDKANASVAYADIMLDGKPLLDKVPVTYLLYLEKVLTDVATFIAKLPTLDPSEKWYYSADQACYCTEMSWSNRSKKELRNHVKAEATPEHPAQVETYTEDVVIGKFETIRHSGALSVDRKMQLQERVHKLKNAVLAARERANIEEVEKQEVADHIFNYLLAP